MSRLEELPPDQRAALSLLLRQRKSYAEVAAMLAIPERAVHDRAHAALAVLAPSLARGLPPQRREEIGDYLLAQQPGVAERLRARTLLGASEPARAWAQAVSLELAPLADGELPDVPLPAPAGAPAGAGLGSLYEAAGRPASGSGRPSSPSGGPLPSSRLGGALLLAAILAAVVVAIVLISGGGSSHRKTTTTTSSASTKTAASGPTVTARLPIRSASRGSSSVGLVQIISEGSKRAFYVVAEGLPPSRGFFYALWLYNSTGSHEPLGKAPPVGSSRRLEGGGALPADAGSFRAILLTRETSTHATHPGTVVLRGRFTLAG
jgi:hypothetical protein